MQRSWRHRFHLPAVIGTIPMILVAVGVFVIGIGFSVLWSFTSSKLFPSYDFVGLAQYRRLWADNRWLVSVNNIWFFGLMSITCNMVFGYLLAVFMDQRIRQEDLFRSIFLYPFAMSLIVTGLVWQWVLDPNLGLQAAMRNLGWSSFSFAPLVDANTAIYALVVAGIWQGSGVTMAILLAGASA
jgi:glucose/mannose transport system permease protein